jgi:hypothetical protein
LPKEDQADVTELLTQVPEAGSMDKTESTGKAEESDMIAVLAEAEAMRQKDQDSPSEAVVETETVVESKTGPEGDAPLPSEPESEPTPQPATPVSIDDFSGILDAWGESNADPESEALADPTDAATTDAELVDEFEQAPSEQLEDETNNSDEPEAGATESIDENAKTVVIDKDPNAPE